MINRDDPAQTVGNGDGTGQLVHHKLGLKRQHPGSPRLLSFSISAKTGAESCRDRQSLGCHRGEPGCYWALPL